VWATHGLGYQNGATFTANVMKVGHHGSINASPAWSFTKVMPLKGAAKAAIVSTDRTRFTGENEVPKASVIAGWKSRLKSPLGLKRTDKLPLGESVEVTLG
jgi:hypothetical protein